MLVSDGSRGVSAVVGLDDEVGETLIFGWLDSVTDDTQDVETGEDRLCERDIVGERSGAVIPAVDGVGGGDNGTACLEGGDDTGFGDGDGLLFHCFVDGGTVLVVHLVEFINETGAAVC